MNAPLAVPERPPHRAHVLCADGTRSTTWMACWCLLGAEHDTEPPELKRSQS